jgi:hypothetical protein
MSWLILKALGALLRRSSQRRDEDVLAEREAAMAHQPTVHGSYPKPPVTGVTGVTDAIAMGILAVTRDV